MSNFTDFFPLGSGGGTPVEWSQSYYDSVFQSSLDCWPEEFTTMPEPASTEQVCYILVAVFDSDSNFTSLGCTGAYTIDWGDGTVENYASGQICEHEWSYTNDTYYNTNTVAKYGHKQALVTITMQAGQTLTSLVFDRYHSSIGSGTSTDMTQPYLAMSIAGSSLINLSLSQANTYVNFGMLRYFRLEQNSLTSMNGMFKYCSSLRTIPLLDISSVTNTYNMFYQCGSLLTVPPLDTSSVTSSGYMFAYCYSLLTVPLLDTSSVTAFNNMFYQCYSLTTIPLLNSSSVVNMNAMFSSCFALKTIPLLDTSSVTNMADMFRSNYSLETIPLLDTSSVTDMSSMFYYCYSLTTIPLLDTSSVTGMTSMFYQCKSLTTIPLLDTSSVTSMTYMFRYCSSLTTIPQLNTSLVTGMTYMVQNCYSLKRCELGFTLTNSVYGAKLSADALDELYTNLPTVSGQTLTVTGNWGTASDDPSIATAKGWTVTG